MNIAYIIIISLALAMDAFAVSAAAGAYYVKCSSRQKFRLSFHFGLFQFGMPIIGWALGAEIVDYVADYDHWISFLLLSIIGINMIREASGGTDKITRDISKGFSLISLSVATSIDALAVGFSFGIMDQSIWKASIIIGITASLMSLLGIKMGETLAGSFGKYVGIGGGIILILIGINVVLNHLGVIGWL